MTPSARTQCLHVAFVFLTLSSFVACTSGDRRPTREPIDASASAGQDSGDAAGDQKVPMAGICFGDKTTCGALSPTPLADGPAVQCSSNDQGPAEISWTADLGSIECPLPDCPLAFPQLAVDMDGSVWATATVLAPGADPFGMADRQAYSLLRFDPGGQRALAALTDVRTRIGGRLVRTFGTFVDSGELSWLAPSGPPGAELRRYDAQGKLVGRRPVSTEATFADALRGADGSVVVALHRPDGSAPATVVPPLVADVARFSASGALLWNQTAFGAVAVNQGNPTAIVGVDPKGKATVLATPADSKQERTLARLDEHGNVSWIVSLGSEVQVAALALDDGGVFVSSLSNDAPNVRLRKLDATGAVVWQASLPDSWSNSALAAVTAGGSVVFTAGDPSGQGPTGVLSVSADGLTCKQWSLDVPVAQPTASGMIVVDDLKFVPEASEVAYFGSITKIGKGRFPGLE